MWDYCGALEKVDVCSSADVPDWNDGWAPQGYPSAFCLGGTGVTWCVVVFWRGLLGFLGFLGGGCVLGATKVTVLHGSTFDHLGF
ncbi:hypothetical protein HMPREF0293_2645 [Corynebacterium glucuronolyticum ATCC 51866]|uniref:Uncharacterized protein n=1 Tax=Corynebacterium glucuronolyticum ATCC 51866 TaxID=548478 RepID=A0ABP2DR81_9CORY|nr:hypothetical protein HMPREF0293_2645 [Corynebacterium glucuronolyticum ATCC 51866]